METNTVLVKFSIPETDYAIEIDMKFDHETNTINYNVTAPENPEMADVELGDMYMLASTFLNAFNPPAGEEEDALATEDEVVLD